MLESPVISVIVAVYQSEKYMRRCLDSIRGQSFSDFEVIMVDDGSRDKSGVICDEYAKLDARFRVIHKKHEGVSAARQTGLGAAIGEYIIHADPDDWVEPNWLENLFGKLKENEADMFLLWECLSLGHSGSTRCSAFLWTPSNSPEPYNK